MLPVIVGILGYLTFGVVSAPYDPREVDWNLNTNQQAVNPLEYSGEWEGHVYTPSPENWRFPFYTLILDRFVNGDPTNDDINGTTFEHDVTSNQLRYGGDLSGLVQSLDYLQGMGIKVSCRMRIWKTKKTADGRARACTLPVHRFSICHTSMTLTRYVIFGTLRARMY